MKRNLSHVSTHRPDTVPYRVRLELYRFYNGFDLRYGFTAAYTSALFTCAATRRGLGERPDVDSKPGAEPPLARIGGRVRVEPAPALPWPRRSNCAARRSTASCRSSLEVRSALDDP